MQEQFDKQAGPSPSTENEEDAAVEIVSHEVEDDTADETTGASPGTAQACNDLGLNSLEANLERFGIRPPGK